MINLQMNKFNKATGLENISCRLLKEAAPVVVKSLCTIFNKSIASGKFPSEWKLSRVIPIHKTDDKDQFSQYRPISILSVVSKVFENFKIKNLLSKHQSGFRSLHSTVTALLDVTMPVNGLRILITAF